jgi:hypothetical protein
LLGMAQRWPWPLNRGGRLIEVLSLIINTKYFWPLNEGPLRGLTVVLS